MLCREFESPFDDFAAEPSQATMMLQAKVAAAQAASTALSKVAKGMVESSELGSEKGKLDQSFDISQPSARDVTEIQINAITGKIVSLKTQSPAQRSESMPGVKEAKAIVVK